MGGSGMSKKSKRPQDSHGRAVTLMPSPFVSPTQLHKPFPAVPTKPSNPPFDATLALSQDALSLLVQRAIDKPIHATGSGSWGPFIAGYDVNLNVTGGAITLIDLGPQIRLEDRKSVV